MTIKLSTVTGDQGATSALTSGVVAPRRYALQFADVPGTPALIQAFRRMVRGAEFDVCEMAATTYLCAKAHGKPFTALPVFPVRGLHHGAIVRSVTAGARSPKDIEGRKAGVSRGYTVTTGVWARGILQDEYGVDLTRVTWVRSGDEHVAEYRPPANVIPMERGRDLTEMVASGELAAGIGVAAGQPGLTPLIADAEEAAYESLRERNLYPINHLVVVRDDLLRTHPGLAADLFAAFAEAKDRYIERLRSGDLAAQAPADLMYRRVMAVTGADPLAYGIAPNRAMIERLIRHAISQRILDRAPAVEDLFPESTHHLTG
jgi:4,5-dihydroxyphthalate decarboxylase